jgi:uncharacterized OB-fold protein
MTEVADLHRGVFPARFDDPYADDRTKPFWDAALLGRLIGSTCSTCGQVLLPPEPRCFRCQGDEFVWRELPGTGTIYSFTVVRHPLAPDLKSVVPYVSGVIDLDGTQGAGSRMIANIVDCDPDSVAIGDKVQVRFDRISDTLALPRFVPAR